jgi:hypothetical protein
MSDDTQQRAEPEETGRSPLPMILYPPYTPQDSVLRFPQRSGPLSGTFPCFRPSPSGLTIPTFPAVSVPHFLCTLLLLHPFQLDLLYSIYKPVTTLVTSEESDHSFPLSPQCFSHQELSAALPLLTASAARVGGFSKFKHRCSGPVRPDLPGIGLRKQVHGHQRSRFPDLVQSDHSHSLDCCTFARS